MEATMVQGQVPPKAHAASAAVALGALGIVYGDIGTSPLYALRETIKAAAAGGPPQREAVLGSVSLILWSLVVIVAVDLPPRGGPSSKLVQGRPLLYG